MKTNTLLAMIPVCLFAMVSFTFAASGQDIAENTTPISDGEHTTDMPSYERPANAIANDTEDYAADEPQLDETGNTRTGEDTADTENEVDTTLSYEPPPGNIQARTRPSPRSAAVEIEKATNLAAVVCRMPGNTLTAAPCATVQAVNLLSKAVRFFVR